MSRLLTAIARLFRPSAKTAERAPSAAARSGLVGGAEPGRSGVDATREVDPHRLARLRTSYSPSVDGDPDPGEIVWTWVPYEEADGRGKDRPVLVVASESGGTVIAVALTSQAHPGRPEYLAIGSGSWDGRRRPSFVRLDRVFRVHPNGMRREAAALDARRFATVRTALQERYGWR
ncbi:type II toxin-antitoxin system PemK/MazF family toxin [Leifsonia shinshuensis]|uniref:type II toxin-antitoxin system PemK/MazF family toxin n=1 Tax=Leifsonia shinshuensis TaxID=150026 RepID=UPI001F50A1C1|nr:type II toxin-antitoxin system PemK/MazF family toxin [Leifsonia shinshuensis]MCI0155753.1 type II toxin-antitoxin system PemK/MazF family toxin [Leifsonia shinshuensis]